jgi:hypothetical protein
MNSPLYKKIFPVILMLVAQLSGNGQATDSQFTSSDSTFTIQLSRQKGEVKISMVLHKKASFDYISIERKSEGDNEFHQCKYIDQKELTSGPANFSRQDMYPAPAGSDVLYRLKIVSANDGMRIYPAVLLPGVNHKL